MFSFDQDFIYVTTEYNQRDKLKGLDGVWVKNKGWKFPKNLWCMKEIEYHVPDLRHNFSFQTVKEQLQQGFAKLLQLKKAPSSNVNPLLRPYQNEDVQYLHHLKSAGVFNEPRTGKTPTTIELLKQLKAEKNVIICPASLIWNWKKEFEKWYPEHKVIVVDDIKSKRRKLYDSFTTGTMIISKDTFKLDKPDIRFNVAVVDEAHFLRNYKSAQSQAICNVNAERRYALTGTPTVKHAVDIFGILKFLYPKKFSNYWAFAERYFYLDKGHFGVEVGAAKAHRKDELQEMIGLMSVQRKRKDIMQWLPNKIRIDIPVQMSGKQEELYEQMSKEFLAWDEDAEVDASNVLTQLLRLRQICIDPRLIGFEGKGNKTRAIVEYLDDNREPIIVMSMFTSYLKLLKEELTELGLCVGMITGEMSNIEKQNTVYNFQSGKLDVVLCNIISAGVGFTLDRAETIIFTDKAWNPSDNEQAEDRITPVSQERNHKHSIITFTVQDSVEHHINNLLKDKKSITDIINEGGLRAIKKLLRGVL